MELQQIYEMLDEVFQDVFDDDSIHVTPETTADDIEDWDSLEHINLVVAVENKFHVKFKMSEVVGFRNVGDMVNVLAERIS